MRTTLRIKVNIKRLLMTVCCIAFFYGAQAQIIYPAHMYADTVHAPFYYGVASGDAMTDRVIIWTHITVDTTQADSAVVYYEVASDSLFAHIILSGSITTNDSVDWTVKKDITGLQPDTYYYYRFHDGQQHYSCVGRTRTAPAGNHTRVRFAVISCSSIYSGFFNAYRQIGFRNDLNSVIHLGDYIYDFVDENEEIRVPQPYPAEPATLAEWRDRHRYYLLDPDLRFARQMHPFSIMWDNHDISGTDKIAPTRAFMEYTPTRQQHVADHTKIYRKLSFGNLADVILLDMMLPRNVDVLPGGGYSALGMQQYNWFIQQLGASAARWKIIGSQKMFSQWVIRALEPVLGNPGGVLNPKAWDGFHEERMNILNFIESNQINNILFISGDAHVSAACDVAKYPSDSAFYNRFTGAGSLAAEFLPTSVSRGNFDEQGFPVSVISQVIDLSMQENPHQQYLDLTRHGYGILDIKPDSISAQFWYCDILNITNQQELGKEMVMLHNENHWKRNVQGTTVRPLKQEKFIVSDIYPNPAEDVIYLDVQAPKMFSFLVKIFEFHSGRLQIEEKYRIHEPNTVQTIKINLNRLPAGAYLMQIYSEAQAQHRVFVKP
jgi:alkaline phosphatase D